MHEHLNNDSHFDFEKLPIEALIEIFSYLSPEDILTQKKVSRKFLKAADAQTLWEKKFNLHFPNRVKEVLKLKEINWYMEFVKAYQDVYSHVPKEKRKLFSLVKEEDLQGIADNLLNPSDLFNISIFDGEEYYLIDLVNKAKESQKILDLIYQKFGNDEATFTCDKGNCNLTPLHWAIICNQPEEIINGLISSSDINNVSTENTPSLLYFACHGGFGNLVKLLLEKGADPNISGTSRNRYIQYVDPLMLAVEKGHANIVEILLTTKRVSTEVINSAIFSASRSGYLDIVNQLVQAGADLKGIGNTDLTLLQQAALAGHNHVVKQLLQYGVEVNAVNMIGDTALHFAAGQGYLHIVDTLVQKGADINVINISRKTPLQMALENGHPEIAKALEIYSERNAIEKKISNDKNSIQTKAFKQLQNFIKEAPAVDLREKALIAFKIIAELAEHPVYIVERNKRRKMNPEDKKDSMEIEGNFEEVPKLPNISENDLNIIAEHYLDDKFMLDVTITELQSMKDKNPVSFFKKAEPTKELTHKKPHIPEI